MNANHQAPPRIIRTETPYTADHYGRIRRVTRATFADGSVRLVALCDIETREGGKYERKTRR